MLLLAALAGTPSAAGDGPAAAPRVNVRSGVLQGARHGAVDEFLGVPYARAPVGALRWRAPEPVEPWSGVRAANAFAPSCPQQWPQPGFGPYTREYLDTPQPDEDCLYLNVWTPAGQRTARPVLVWIHGGGFGGGSGAIEIYNGAALAARGIVVITINYRVGVFGFLAHPELTREAAGSGAGNQGLQDMIAALRWVHDNVRAFGGDPRRVTVAGQSAGAVAVNDLIVSPAARGLFARAIAQSGSAFGVPAIPLAEAEHSGEQLAETLGVRSLAALRALPWQSVQGAVLGYMEPERPGARRIPLRPVLDGAVLPEDPIRGSSHVVTNVPLLTGYTADEFVSPGNTTPADFEKLVRQRYGTHAERLLALYPHATDAQASASARTLARDAYMAPLVFWADARVRSARQRIYTYLYEHPAPVPAPPAWGTFHSSEIPYVFGVLNRAHRPYTEADERIAAQLQEYWLNFIRSGNPNGRGLARWRRWVPGDVDVMGIGDAPGARPAVSSPERLEALRDYAEDGGTFSLM
ncbi:MAG: carboxylesterase family protein [Gammaproteobacteria bacterium]|nr:carboxylesterase family protein [Gammaproteobacteria bacterium]